MPEDSKKNNAKSKQLDPKEQRKPRQARNQAGKSERKAEKIADKPSHKVTVPQKPVYEDPGPEFYKNLKRETEEIVKITEAENEKYRKKEIQSNWAKYEMPIESYEDLDEQDIGADYEKLIQAPLSAGGHFQFKHEKSWDTTTAPSLYDKYFEINMDNLAMAISTIPFYERNNINQVDFSETDMLSMNHRASKYKQKYFNDKSATEPHDKIIKILRENLVKQEKDDSKVNEESSETKVVKTLDSDYQVNLDFNVSKTESVTSVPSNMLVQPVSEAKLSDKIDDFDDEFLFKDAPHKIKDPETESTISEAANLSVGPEIIANSVENKPSNEVTTEHPVAAKNPVIESPEDLEKWLDDFLDS